MINIRSIVEEIGHEYGSNHLGECDDIRVQLAFLFDANNKALTSELDNLRKTNILIRAASWFGLGLIIIGIVIIISGVAGIGIISSLCGLLFTLIHSHMARRLREARKEIRARLPSYRNLFALQLLLNEGDGAPSERIHRAIEELFKGRGIS